VPPRFQWQLQAPPQQCPPPLPPPVAAMLVEPALAEAKVENFLDNFLEPQCGHSVPFQSDERTRISLSVPHFSQ
jgi:hypothetical protein